MSSVQDYKMPRLHLCYKSPVSSGYFFQEIHSKLWKSLVFALFTCNVLCSSSKEDLMVIDSCWFPCRKLFSPPTKIITMDMLITTIAWPCRVLWYIMYNVDLLVCVTRKTSMYMQCMLWLRLIHSARDQCAARQAWPWGMDKYAHSPAQNTSFLYWYELP